MKKLQAGITYIEIMIGLAMFSLLLTLTTINFPNIIQRASMDATVVTMVSDIKNQQLKAMVGADNGDGAFTSFGVHFQPDRYTLFRGGTYKLDNTTNYEVILGDPVRLQTINLPNAEIIFSIRSGQIQNFDGSQNSLTLVNTASGQQKTAYVNKLGVVTRIEGYENYTAKRPNVS